MGGRERDNRGCVRTGAMGAIAPIDFENFKDSTKKKIILKIKQELTELVVNV